jgi:hypothetical protein
MMQTPTIFKTNDFEQDLSPQKVPSYFEKSDNPFD